MFALGYKDIFTFELLFDEFTVNNSIRDEKTYMSPHKYLNYAHDGSSN